MSAMNAPNACHACGSALPAGIGWCPACHAEQRRQFVPREVPLETPPELDPMTPAQAGRPSPAPQMLARPVYSRRAEGATSLGYRARLAVTGIIILMPVMWMGAFPGVAFLMTLGVMLAYVPLAILVLRDVWRKTRVDATAVEAREEIEARGPMISATRRPELPFLARWALVTGGIVFAGLAVTAFFVGQVGEILLLVSMLISALVLFGAWVLRG